MKNKPQEMAEIKVCDRIKYLGITIKDSQNLFKVHNAAIVERAVKMVDITYSIVARSCSMLLIGNVYCKSIALLGILNVSSIIYSTSE